jgi:uncharacterized protein (TIGR01777 family)
VRVAVTGSSGLIGTALSTSLERDGHDVLRVRRGEHWDPTTGRIDRAAFEGLDAVVHLGGVGIADSRWTAAQKGRVLTSRTAGTTLLATTLARLDAPPAVLLSGSAVGYYGDHGDTIIDESSTPGDDFPARVCIEWEASAAAAADAGIRVAYLRTGVVQATEGGALAKQLPFFRLGLGGRAGSGRQYLSWITLVDEVRAIRFLLDHDVSGPVNLVAPEPVTNAEYTTALGAALHRPTTILPMIGPRLLYGRELADSLLLTSQRAVPAVLLEAGFDFEHPTLPEALESVLG